MERDREFKYCLLLTIVVFSGLHISDLLQLKYRKFENGNILTIQEKKTKKVRRIKINQDLKTIVLRIKNKMGVTDPDQYIFLNRHGTKPVDKSWVNVQLKKYFKKYGIEIDGNISSPLFRKTLGNRVLKLYNYSGEAIILLMELFGHSSPAITKKYFGIREREIHDVYDSLRL